MGEEMFSVQKLTCCAFSQHTLGVQGGSSSDGQSKHVTSALNHVTFSSCFSRTADEVGAPDEATPLRRGGSQRCRLFWVSHMDGMQRVFVITQDKKEAKKIQQVLALSSQHDAAFWMDVVFLSQFSDDEPAQLELFSSLQAVGVSLVSSKQQEVAFISLTGSPAFWMLKV